MSATPSSSLVPAALTRPAPSPALCLHLCIGMAYGLSVFWLPLKRAVGIETPFVCPADASFHNRLTSTTSDRPLLGRIYSLNAVLLSSSAACFRRWLKRLGPLVTGVAATGVALQQLWIPRPWHQFTSTHAVVVRG
jgi:hypothetical protein